MPGRARLVSKHSQAKAGSTPLVDLVTLGLGLILTAVALFYLGRAAVEFAVVAVREGGAAWLFAFGAVLGAVVSMVLVLALVGRVLRTLGFISDYKPRRAGARRRR
ncbi:MAG TPA: hypothetical protein VLB29_16660 [Nocardioidaceae bacterium]|nr:hypothetical protein [Nocardioidaceae bacterium]